LNAGAAPLPALRRSGAFLVDQSGHVVILHGVNLVYKRAPYYPNATDLTAADVRNIVTLGFSAVRLGVLWEGVEPCKVGASGCTGYDDGYLAKIDAIVRQFEARGVYVLLDFHQDLYTDADMSPVPLYKYHGEGAPKWATNNDGWPVGPSLYPLWGAEYVLPAENAAFDHLLNPANDWNDIQAHYRAAWMHVAAHYASDPGILGYDIMNEPWPETLLPGAAQNFDRNNLQTFDQGVIDAIRSVDQTHTIFYEPNILNDFGPPYTMDPGFDPRDLRANLGLSYHVYCLIPGLNALCQGGEAATLDAKDAEARTRGVVPFVSEFGAGNNIDGIGHVADLIDGHKQGWTYWAWKWWNDPTGSEDEWVADANGVLNQDKAAQLARTYPRSISADDPGTTGREPTWCFTRHVPPGGVASTCPGREGRFTLDYDANAPGGVTAIFVPVRAPLDAAHRLYQNGYVVTSLTGAHVTSAQNAPLLTVVNDTEGPVHLVLDPR
jgi:endoglycosylceramidase